MNFGQNVRIGAISRLLLIGMVVAVSAFAFGQSDQVSPPPPPPGEPGMMLTMHGPGMGGFFHEEIGEGHKVVTGAPMTAVITTTRDQSLSDGNTIHNENQTTVYRDSQGRVRREVQFELVTPSTGAKKGTMIVIMDPVAGHRYMLNPQTKVAHEMPLRPPKPPTGEAGEPWPRWKSGDNVATAQLGTKTILGLQATGTQVTRTIPAGQIGNAKPIEVVTTRWESTDLQIPLSVTHSDPMMGTMTSNVTSVNRGEPDASLFQVPSDYKIEAVKPGDMMYMPAKPRSTTAPHCLEVPSPGPPFLLLRLRVRSRFRFRQRLRWRPWPGRRLARSDDPPPGRMRPRQWRRGE